MGAWGEKAFENDSALDWLGELERRGVSALRGALSTAAKSAGDDYLDVDDGSAAIAAAEIVAAARGKGRDRLTEQAMAWLDTNARAVVEEDLVLARRAVIRVLGHNSELSELWGEGGPDGEWHADMRVLLLRLGGDPGDATPPGDAPTEKTRPQATPGAEGGGAQSKTVLLTFLRARGLEPSAEQMARIRSRATPWRFARGWPARSMRPRSPTCWTIGRRRGCEESSAATSWASIAFELGYCDQAHFIREVQKLFGCTPGEVVRQVARTR